MYISQRKYVYNVYDLSISSSKNVYCIDDGEEEEKAKDENDGKDEEKEEALKERGGGDDERGESIYRLQR